MKHTILAQMLGNFRMEYDGKPLCAERMHRDGQFVRMMQAILYFAKKGISKDKLEEYVVGERINHAFMEKEKSKKKKYRIHCSFAEIS